MVAATITNISECKAPKLQTSDCGDAEMALSLRTGHNLLFQCHFILKQLLNKADVENSQFVNKQNHYFL